MKPIIFSLQPIAPIGCKKCEPIKPITNLLQGGARNRFETLYIGNIYTYKKYNNLLTYYSIHPRAFKNTPFLHARLRVRVSR